MGNVARLLSSLYDTPHLAIPSVLDSAMDYLVARNAGTELHMKGAVVQQCASTTPAYDAATKTGTIHINGPLTYRPTILSAACGLQSYQGLLSDFQTLSEQAKTIVLMIDSGGGEAYSMMETASAIRSIADAKGIRLVSYVDGIAGSAAFGLACAAHEVIANPESQVGSIGVVVKLRNSNKAMQKAGIEETYVYAGKSKIPFNQAGDWSESFVADLQAKVDHLFTEFTGFVASNRGLPASTVIDTQAKMFLAKEALNLGLIDAVMTREQFAKHLSTNKPMKRMQSTTGPTESTKEPTSAEKDSSAFERNHITGMLQRKGAYPVLSKKAIADRMLRLTGFGLRNANQILKSTEHLRDNEFENAVQKLEISIGIRHAS